MAQIFAIKDVVKGTLKEYGNAEDAGILVDYANDCQLELTGETTYARKAGNNSISFGGSKSGTFTFNTEMLTLEILSLILGGTYDKTNEKISVTGDNVSKSYTFEGTVNVKFEGESDFKVMDIKLYNISPQISGSIQLSATDVGSFSLVFDVMVDADNNICDFMKHKAV